MFSFELNERDFANCKRDYASFSDPEIFVKHIFERMHERPQLEKMIEDMNDDISDVYEIPVSEVTDSLRMLCPHIEDIWFHYSYYIDACYIRQRRDKWLKSIIVLKKFFSKIREPYLQWYYNPDGPGGIKAIQSLKIQAGV